MTTNLQTLRAALSTQFVERDETIGALLTAIMANEHAFMLGEPGTAKTALAHAIALALGGLKWWEVLMTRFSTPEDLFGPVKLSALQADRFERATDGYLPSAELAFLDECWKANGGILNALLTIMNERVYHNGGAPVPVPLVSCIGASNELPEGPELEALYDRFMVRIYVERIADRGNFLSMLQAPATSIPVLLVDLKAEQAVAAAVVLGSDIFEAMADTRTATQKAGMVISDRRWRKSLSLVRATAHLDGRTTATADDLSVLEHVLWREPGERSAVSRLVQSVVNPNAAKAVECVDAAKDARRKLDGIPETGKGAYLSACAEANQTLIEISSKLTNLGTGAKIAAAKATVTKLHKEVSQLASRAMGIAS